MTEVEAAVAVSGVGGESVDGVGDAGAAGTLDPAAGAGVGAVWVAAAGSGEGVERGAVVGVVGEGDGAGSTGGAGGGVLGTGRVRGSCDCEDTARLCGEFDVAGVGEVEAVVAGGGDEDDICLGGGVGDLVEGGEEASAVSGGEVGYCADGEGDDVRAIGDRVFDSLHDPAEETAGLAGFALIGWVGVAGDGRGHALEDFDVEDGRGGSYADDLSGSGTESSGCEGGGPGAVALLILGGAVVAGTGVGGLVDFGEVECEVGGDIGVGCVDAAVDDGDADAFAHGGVPGAVRGCAGDVVSVAADLLDGPSLWGRGVVGVVGG